jgi:hypothetical protein
MKLALPDLILSAATSAAAAFKNVATGRWSRSPCWPGTPWFAPSVFDFTTKPFSAHAAPPVLASGWILPQPSPSFGDQALYDNKDESQPNPRGGTKIIQDDIEESLSIAYSTSDPTNWVLAALTLLVLYFFIL